MKSLLWKEWRQHRTLVLAGVAVAVLLAVLSIFGATLRLWWGLEAISWNTIMAYAGLLGLAMVASEVGSGTIVGLFSRPVNPWKVWVSKAVFGLGATYAVVFVHIFAKLLALWIVEIEMDLWDPTELVIPLFFGPVVFAVAMFASTLATKSLHALPGALLSAAGFFGCWSGCAYVLEEWLSMSEDFYGVWLAILAVIGSSMLFLVFSAVIFVKGHIHTGLSKPKWRLAGGMIGGTLLVWFIGLACFVNGILASEPGEDYGIARLLPSRDGRHAAIVVKSGYARNVGALWIVDLQSGERLFPSLQVQPWTYDILEIQPGWSPDGLRFAIWHDGLMPRFPLRLDSAEPRLSMFDVERRTVSVLRESQGEWWGTAIWSRSGDKLYNALVVHCEDANQNSCDSIMEHISPNGDITNEVRVKDAVVGFAVAGEPPLFVCQPGSKDPDGHARGYLVNAETGETAAIDFGERDPSFVRVEAVSPDHRYLVYQVINPSPDLHAPDSLLLRDLATGTDTRLLEDRTLNLITVGSFSPDSKRFVLMDWGARSLGGARNRNLYVFHVERGTAILLSDQGRFMRSARWCPVGLTLAVVDREVSAGQSSLIVFRFRHSEVDRQTLATGQITDADWLSDDDLLYADGTELYRIKLDGTGREKVFPK